jgi:hypothetical protein
MTLTNLISLCCLIVFQRTFSIHPGPKETTHRFAAGGGEIDHLVEFLCQRLISSKISVESSLANAMIWMTESNDHSRDVL